MTWKELLETKKIQTHVMSAQEANNLRDLIARDLSDAGVANLSVDRRFAIAYNAALQAATLVLHCAGYRARGIGHHETTFHALPLAMGKTVEKLAGYFDICRRKRNVVEYDISSTTTETELKELLASVHMFCNMADTWILKHHPEFSDGSSK